MAKRLLDRQASLLDYLTSAAAMFDAKGAATAPRLHGIDPVLLHFEARFSYEKRMEKIAAAFPRTLALLEDPPRLMRRFAIACPPADISRLANARQFHAFLTARWRHKPPKPPYVRDVARCELACAEARALQQAIGERTDAGRGRPGTSGIRRNPGCVLLRCRFDVRPIFEEGSRTRAPSRRDTRLAVTMPPDSEQPQVFELPPATFDLVVALDDWVDPSAFGLMRDARRFVRDLVRHGILEACG
jgi:hypothetical protein